MYHSYKKNMYKSVIALIANCLREYFHILFCFLLQIPQFKNVYEKRFVQDKTKNEITKMEYFDGPQPKGI